MAVYFTYFSSVTPVFYMQCNAVEIQDKIFSEQTLGEFETTTIDLPQDLLPHAILTNQTTNLQQNYKYNCCEVPYIVNNYNYYISEQ